MVNSFCGQAAIADLRASVIPRAHGRVLEIGSGSGLNLPFYSASSVSEVVGIDPSDAMHAFAQKSVDRAQVPVTLVKADAQSIPLETGTFDTAVVTYSLCTIPNPNAALGEVARLLKAGGALLFCEHGLAPDASVARWQRWLNPMWGLMGGGCRLNRDITGLISAAGFSITDDRRDYLPGFRPAGYHYCGAAVCEKAASAS